VELFRSPGASGNAPEAMHEDLKSSHFGRNYAEFAVNAIAEALRQEVGQQGVRVTTIEPGAVETEFSDAAGYPPGNVEALKVRLHGRDLCLLRSK
jgi:NAD(P)-dependent dehydrogenase (short-subunit alcohol dehydrogenase family)